MTSIGEAVIHSSFLEGNANGESAPAVARTSVGRTEALADHNYSTTREVGTTDKNPGVTTTTVTAPGDRAANIRNRIESNEAAQNEVVECAGSSVPNDKLETEGGGSTNVQKGTLELISESPLPTSVLFTNSLYSARSANIGVYHILSILTVL